MTQLLVFLAGCWFGSLVTTGAIAIMAAGKIGDVQPAGQQQWRDEVGRLLGE